MSKYLGSVGLGLVGLALGGYIGYLNRPTTILIGQLPFSKIILDGANLKGFETILAPTAHTSFKYVLIGALIGLLSGIILGLLLRSEKR